MSRRIVGRTGASRLHCACCAVAVALLLTDSANGQQIMGLLRDLNRREGLTIVMVTHNLELVHDTDRVVRLAGGQIEPEDKISPPDFAAVGDMK